MHRATVMLLFAAGAAQAHPGHVDGPLWHLVTEPDHLAMILLPLVVAGGIWLYRRKVRASRRSRKDG